MLAGDIGIGPPGEEDEHEPHFAITAEAGFNDGLAFPFVLLGLVIAEERGRRASGSPADVVYALLGGGRDRRGAGHRHRRGRSSACATASC